jgi:hypothetical protein
VLVTEVVGPLYPLRHGDGVDDIAARAAVVPKAIEGIFLFVLDSEAKVESLRRRQACMERGTT